MNCDISSFNVVPRCGSGSADPRSSLTETKSSRKESSFLAEMALTKSVVAANRKSQVSPNPRKFVALYYRNTKIRTRSNERDE